MQSCSGKWVFIVMAMAAEAPQIEASCGRRRRGRPQKQLAAGVADADAAVDDDGRAGHPRSLPFGC